MMFLEGIRVLDLSRVLAGPLATQNLADMGAEVLKIEAPLGDDTRRWGPPFQEDMAAYYQSCNRSKVSLVLDFKNPQDYQRLQDLIAAADVVIDNFPPNTRQRWGLSSQDLRKKYPELITMSITGYRGDRLNEPGYDVMVQAESGFMGITGPEEGEPSKVGVAVIDVLTGMMASNGILGSLVRRERHGMGASLEISLFQTALYSLVNVATNHLVSGEASQRWGNAHANIVPYQPFATADRSLVIGAGNQRQFLKLCQLLGLDDPDLLATDNAERLAKRDWVLQQLSQAFAQRSSESLLSELRQAGIPAAPILRPDEAIREARQWNPETLLAIPHATLGEIAMIAPPLRGEGMRQNHLPPPLLGEGGRALAERWLTH